MYKTGITLQLLVAVLLAAMMTACGDPPVPKPRGYFRIDLPQREYRLLDSIYPYTFEIPVYAKITGDPNAGEEPYWINIDFPAYKGRIHLSYKAVDNNLSTFTEDAHQLVMKHIPKASAIDEIRIDNEALKVHGLIYDIKGAGAASPYQFFATDSTRHFIRGALYFNVLPNNDSLAPVIEFLKGDIRHMLETLKWK
ncbi:gliding motility lipoprotein GldD [Lentimicrobium sp.]|jgi:gliding motility-associated lipoprotein GldD|uniref:gliding motility lipoprotein GldD n=1 Tax=Lentimicrobium sp. TaxID=2034841 RepID=UPI0025F1B3A1|nr:gliding motility lipoprotein GldD [Lentimicrobium sp.]MCO5256791.1 gliding motility lipoprotein GldD [Lentimicrobium sp.]HOP14346.1 gliding motility lipoprotein GldD [Lentimicrobium sp.]HPF65945.1 gliding motility lipoprotein GldD [Lentimicrobium sp.]HPJ63850.1 gliding motility lipoprotein GldD [Lentimicrobium sp.]HPR27543.1 gliding motility lipoprotein GldD [Lentimicrobium sp.]